MCRRAQRATPELLHALQAAAELRQFAVHATQIALQGSCFSGLVAAGLADRCEIQVAYAIGVAEPVSLNVDTFGTETIDPERIRALVSEHFDLRPGAIIRDLDLLRPIYRKTAAYGHFGRPDIDLPWENTDRAAALRSAAGL